MKRGLTDEEVLKNRNKYGNNEINKINHNSFWHLLLESLGDPIIKILLIALGMKTVFLIRNFDWYETIGIVIAIFLASFISTISEYGSEKAFDKLQEESSKIKCKVKRNEVITSISIDEVVCGDIVILEAGDKIPADGIIIEGEIGVDESSINGEAKEIWKRPSNNGFEEDNKVFRGTTVYSKKGVMQVTNVGINTFYGKLALDLQMKNPDSPLKLRLRKLAGIISKIGYIAAFLVSFSYLFNVIIINNSFNITKIIDFVTNYPVLIGHILHALTLSVTIIVVAVPEDCCNYDNKWASYINYHC